MSKVLNKVKARVLSTIKNYWIALMIIALYLTFFTQAKVISGSMEPNLMTGDYTIVLDRFFYEPQRGDVVAFLVGYDLWIKRVIGVGGDTIEIKDGLVYVNGEQIQEDYLAEGVYTYAGRQSVYNVPEGCVFLLGDHRGNSNDARYWDDPYVSTDRIVGTYFFTVFHTQSKEQMEAWKPVNMDPLLLDVPSESEMDIIAPDILEEN